MILDLDVLYGKSTETNTLPDNNDNDNDDYNNDNDSSDDYNETEDFTNSALEEFLIGFSDSDETNETDKNEEIETEEDSVEDEIINKISSYDADLQSLQENTELNFSKEDINRINKLLIEISDDTLRNIDEYTTIAKQELAEKHPSKQELLEHFVATYTIDYHVSFSKEDIDALNKLINVELDRDFVTDLRTDPTRTKKMREDIINYRGVHRVSETKTMHVQEKLPDMAMEAKKVEGSYIVSDAQPEVIDYGSNCEVETISVNDMLPDLEKEKYNVNANKHRPSDDYEVALSGYEYTSISVADQLPDLEDVMANPQKYEEKKEDEFVPDENELLARLSNVTFKPFYEEKKSETSSENTIEISENSQKLKIQEEPDDEKDFAELFKEQKSIEKVKPNTIQPNKTTPVFDRKNISSKKSDRIKPQITRLQNKQTIPESCTIENVEYKIISGSNIAEDKGCYLVKDNNSYCIVGFNKTAFKKIKKYETLKTETLQARINDKLPDGTLRCLIKVGLNKFIMTFTENDMEYVMDLC